MPFINRAKNLLLSPRTEWEVISGESLSGMRLIFSYLLPLAIVASLASFIGDSFRTGSLGLWSGLIQGIDLLIQLVVGIYIYATKGKNRIVTVRRDGSIARSLHMSIATLPKSFMGAGMKKELAALGKQRTYQPTWRGQCIEGERSDSSGSKLPHSSQNPGFHPSSQTAGDPGLEWGTEGSRAGLHFQLKVLTQTLEPHDLFADIYELALL